MLDLNEFLLFSAQRVFYPRYTPPCDEATEYGALPSPKKGVWMYSFCFKTI